MRNILIAGSSSLIALFIVSVVMRFLLPVIQKKVDAKFVKYDKNAIENRSVSMPYSKVFLWLMVFVNLCNIILTVVIIALKDDLHDDLSTLQVVIILLWVFDILDGVFLIIFCKKIHYNNESFTVQNALGYKRIFYYDDIIRIAVNKNYCIHFANKKVRVFNGWFGATGFINFVRSKRTDL